MGLFKFVKEAGEKLFGIGKAEAVEKHAEQNVQVAEGLTGLIKNLGFEIQDLRIEFADGKAVVHGKAPSQEIREKVVLVVGNTQGVALVDDQMTVEAPEPEAVMYTVVSGDTLSRIAKQHYGDANKYMRIFEANKPMLKDPNKIYPGQVLRIPPMA